MLNNGITIQFGQGKFFEDNGTSQVIYSITLPIVNKHFTTGNVNCDVGSSGFQYLNGISVYPFYSGTSDDMVGCRLTEIQGRYAIGSLSVASNGLYYSFISIGY